MSDREEHPQSENEEGGLSSLDLATSQTALRKTKRPHNKDRKEGCTDEEGQEMEEVPKAKDRKSPDKDHNAATRTHRKRRAHREKKGIKDSRMHLSTRVLNAITKHTTVGEDVEEEEAKVYVNPFSIKELKKPDFYTAIFAELLVSAIFVCLSIFGGLATTATYTGSDILTAIIIYHFFLVILLIYAFGPLSGAQFNPSITVAALLTQRITIVRAVGYLLAQIVGAIMGAAFSIAATNSNNNGNLGLVEFASGVSDGQALCMEFVLSTSIVFVVFALAFDPRGLGKLAPLGITVMFVLCIYAGSFVSGPSLNPIRPFGPAVVHGTFFSGHWVYWVGDILGGCTGAGLYEVFFMQRRHARAKGVPSTAGDHHYHKNLHGKRSKDAHAFHHMRLKLQNVILDRLCPILTEE